MPMEYTMTCWTPVKHNNILYHCGGCYACVERKDGFNDAKFEDPTKYFNELEIEK